jgi:hypothetical protein
LLNASIATILAAVIALVGTVLGLVVGYRRWAKERQSVRFAKFEADQQDIYKTLWERVEGVNVALRRGHVDEKAFAQLVGDLNEFMLRNGAHLNDSDRMLANRYVGAVKRFHEAVLAAGADVQIPYGETQDIPPEVTRGIKAFADAADEAKRLRDELRSKVRTVLAGRP